MAFLEFFAQFWLTMWVGFALVLSFIMVPKRKEKGYGLLEVVTVSVSLGMMWPVTAVDLWRLYRDGEKEKGKR